MPSPELILFSTPTKAIQYTGTNSADIDAQVPGVGFVSELEGTFTFSYNNNEQFLHVGDWIMWNMHAVFTASNNQFNVEWACSASCDQLDALTLRVEALENP